MAGVRVIGLDIAKSVFQLHGVDAAGAVVLQKRLPLFNSLLGDGQSVDRGCSVRAEAA